MCDFEADSCASRDHYNHLYMVTHALRADLASRDRKSDTRARGTRSASFWVVKTAFYVILSALSSFLNSFYWIPCRKWSRKRHFYAITHAVRAGLASAPRVVALPTAPLDAGFTRRAGRHWKLANSVYFSLWKPGNFQIEIVKSSIISANSYEKRNNWPCLLIKSNGLLKKLELPPKTQQKR